MVERNRFLPLFKTFRERLIALVILGVLFAVHIGWDILRWTSLPSGVSALQGEVIRYEQRTSRWGDPYIHMRVRSDSGVDLFINTSSQTPSLLGHRISMLAFVPDVPFVSMYQGISLKAQKIIDQGESQGIKKMLGEKISSQHTDPLMKELFLALFLDYPMSPPLQDKVSLFGLAALMSLSGLNVGILSGMLLVVLTPLYTFFQNRFFPYRHRQYDLAVIVAWVMIGYLVLVDFMPSFLRAVAMLIVGGYLYFRRIEIANMEVLGWIVTLLIALRPPLVLSIGFWFSVAGVYFIYLYLHYWGQSSKWAIAVGLACWIYIAMLPIIHAVFDLFSFAQLSSPLTSLVFDLVYPVIVVAHCLGVGGVGDTLIGDLLSYTPAHRQLSAPLWFVMIYVGVALAASRDKTAFWLLNILMGVFFGLGVMFAI